MFVLDGSRHPQILKEYLKDNSINYKNEDYIKYNGLFSSLNITKIPVLLVKKNDNNIIILNGVSEIIEYFNNNKENKTLPVISHHSVKTKSFTLNMEEDGCGVNYLKKELENCEKDGSIDLYPVVSAKPVEPVISDPLPYSEP